MFNKKRIEELEKKLERKIKRIEALAFEAKFPDGNIVIRIGYFSGITNYLVYGFLNKLHDIKIPNEDGFKVSYKIIENDCKANAFVIEKQYKEKLDDNEFNYKYFFINKETEAISNITNIYK